MALDGQPARFLVGGQFPFPVPQSSSIPGGTAVVTIQFRRFGTILNFIPQILPNDVIRLDVEPVVSRLNFTQGTTVNGGRVPAILERSARTVVELREGQTLAIAGLLQLATNADHGPDPRPRRPADRRALVQQQHHRDDRDRDHHPGDPRARRPAREERGDRGAGRPGLSSPTTRSSTSWAGSRASSAASSGPRRPSRTRST